MTKPDKKDLAQYPETATWCLLRMINTPVVDPHNEFTATMAPAVPEYSYVQVTVKHNFSETFERKKYDGKPVGKS